VFTSICNCCYNYAYTATSASTSAPTSTSTYIVTCTVYFSIGATTAVDDIITIDAPIQEPASDYTSLGSIMGSITSNGIENWRNLDFAGGTTNGLSFFIRTTAPITIQNVYVAHFSYAYDTSLC
jgi:hypothetical protein